MQATDPLFASRPFKGEERDGLRAGLETQMGGGVEFSWRTVQRGLRACRGLEEMCETLEFRSRCFRSSLRNRFEFPSGLFQGPGFPSSLNQLRRFPVRILNRFGLGTRT